MERRVRHAARKAVCWPDWVVDLVSSISETDMILKIMVNCQSSKSRIEKVSRFIRHLAGATVLELRHLFSV